MAQNSGGGSTPWLAVLVGGLLVAVAVIAWFLYAGGPPRPQMPRSVDIDVNVPRPPAIPDAPKLPDAPLPTPK